MARGYSGQRVLEPQEEQECVFSLSFVIIQADTRSQYAAYFTNQSQRPSTTHLPRAALLPQAVATAATIATATKSASNAKSVGRAVMVLHPEVKETQHRMIRLPSKEKDGGIQMAMMEMEMGRSVIQETSILISIAPTAFISHTSTNHAARSQSQTHMSISRVMVKARKNATKAAQQ